MAQYANVYRVGRGLLVALLVSMPASAFAGEADVVAAAAVRQSNGAWRISVMLRHSDEGWERYADRWDVVGSDGTVYG